jgi:hypothetical protein
MSLLSLPHDY